MSKVESEEPNGQVVVKRSELPDKMTQEATDITIHAMDKYTVEQDIATYIKKEMDKRSIGIPGSNTSTWHCIVGQSFGSYVTHENDAFVHLEKDATAVLLFRK